MNWDSAHLRRSPEVCFPGAKASQKSLSIAARGVAHRAALTRHGFTLIELIVVIGVIAVLIGLMLPVLSQSMISAKRTRAAATLRQAHLLVSMYTQQSKDVYPIYGSSIVQGMYEWYGAVIRSGLASSFEQIDPTGSRSDVPVTFALSPTVLGNPDLFQPRPRMEWRASASPSPVRASDVLTPAEKGVMWQWWPNWDRVQDFWCCGPYRSSAPVAFVDGHIVLARWTQFEQRPPPNRDFGVGFPVVSTWNGYQGTDRIVAGEGAGHGPDSK